MESRRWSVKKNKKHPSSCGFLMDQLALVQDGTPLMKKLKATGLNCHLVSLVLLVKHEVGVVLVHFNMTVFRIRRFTCIFDLRLQSRVSSASCCSDDLLQINLHLSPGSVLWVRRYETILSVLTSTVLASFLALWQAARLFVRFVGSIVFSLRTSRCRDRTESSGECLEVVVSAQFCSNSQFSLMLWQKDIVRFFRRGRSPRMTLDYTWELMNKRFAAPLWVLKSSEKVCPKETEGVF